MKPFLLSVAFLLLLIPVSANTLVSGKMHFVHINRESGLSHNQVHCLMQDSHGFVWVGTISGLNRFDGESIKCFTHDSYDDNSISNNNITNIWEDHRGIIWVRTPDGLDFLDPLSEKFSHSDTIAFANEALNLQDITNFYKDLDNGIWIMSNWGIQYGNSKMNELRILQHVPNDATSMSTNFVSDVCQDAQHDFWLVHRSGILDLLDGKTLQVKDRFTFHPSKSSASFYQLCIDRSGNVWIWDENDANGAYRFDPQTKSLDVFSTRSSKYRISSDIVTDIIEDENGLIWISTDHGGISIYNPKESTVSEIQNDPFDDKSLVCNAITNLMVDRDGTLWIGSFKDGIDLFHEDLFRFDILKDDPSKSGDLGSDDINCIESDGKGNLWFGSNGDGLIQYNESLGTFRHFSFDKNNSNSVSNDVIVTMKCDRHDRLWVGTYYGGLNMWDGSRFSHYYNDPDDSTSLSDNRVWAIFEDSDDNLWVGTLGGGLNLFDRKRNRFDHFRSDDINSISSDYIFSIVEDGDNAIWFATTDGVSRFSHETGRFINYRYDSEDRTSLSHNNTTCLLVDSRNRLWVGTREGLNLFRKEFNAFDRFYVQDGLPDNYIVSMAEDDFGNVWVTTPYNLTKLSIRELASDSLDISFFVYDKSDGLQTGEFNVNSMHKAPNGDIFVGGTKGVNYFKPRQQYTELRKSEVIITDFKLFNNSISIGQKVNGRTLLDSALFVTKLIELKHDENSIGFSFSDLNIIGDASNFYYKLEGFDNAWIQGDRSHNQAQYANLPPGTYTFAVKKSDSAEGVSFSEKMMTIVVAPPFWKTIYAYLIYLVVVLGTLELLRQIVIRRERKKSQARQESERLKMQQEMDVMKMRFFTNVSHELKTPLSLILSPIEGLMKETTDKKLFDQFQIIHRNALRLYNMVNQLLDFRKIDMKQESLDLVDGDLNLFVKDSVDSFAEMANKKDILLSFESSEKQIFTAFDKRKMERIIFNFLSNAFKFTPGKGAIKVSISVVPRTNFPKLKLDECYDNVIVIEVADSGVGISPENLSKVFDRFYQEHDENLGYNEGSGIGLSIAKDFAALHGGDISLESEKGKGSRFSLVLPYRQVLSPKLPVDPETILDENEEVIDDDSIPSILVVDDNDDFRTYIRHNLEASYRVIEAENGEEALQIATNYLPDLIVGDVMMPLMDGLEMSRKLKSDIRTSHIPIILLTAVNNSQKMLDGFQIGIDDYMTKPFNPEILSLRIKNLIEKREKLKENFKIQMKMTPSDIQVTSLDDKLINKTIEVVEANMSNPDFSVLDLSKELGMSRVNLYKKLKTLTGYTPIEFIRIFRIRRAAQLLAQSQMGVSEVAYQVGFNDPRYFTRYFKAEYKLLPSEYSKKHKTKPDVEI